jgi:hypothetical protein
MWEKTSEYFNFKETVVSYSQYVLQNFDIRLEFHKKIIFGFFVKDPSFQ